jgi:hypothetical protein
MSKIFFDITSGMIGQMLDAQTTPFAGVKIGVVNNEILTRVISVLLKQQFQVSYKAIERYVCLEMPHELLLNKKIHASG